MAIDTAAKRRGAGSGFGTIPPAPDGMVNGADRQQAAWIYRGILVSTLVVVIGNARATSAARAHPQATLVADE